MNKLITIALVMLLPCLGISQKLKSIIKNNDTLKLEKFIAKGGDIDVLILAKNKDKEEMFISPLSYAQVEKSYEVLDMLIIRADSFERKDHYLAEVFIHSLARDEDKLSQKLYDLGVNINDSCGLCHNNNAILVAANDGNDKWYFKLKPESDLFYKNENGAGLLHAAIVRDNNRIIKDIITIEGYDINEKNNEGLTPLDFTVWIEELPGSAFSILMDAGADFRNTGFMFLRYGYHPHPDIGQFAVGMVEENAEKVFEIDEEGYHILDYLVEIQNDEITSDQHLLLYNVLDQMIIQLDSFNNKGYTNEFLLGENVTQFIAYISLMMEDDPTDYMHLFRKYIEFIGVSVKKGYTSPITKKDYKYAKGCFGEEELNKWFGKYKVPIPE